MSSDCGCGVGGGGFKEGVGVLSVVRQSTA